MHQSLEQIKERSSIIIDTAYDDVDFMIRMALSEDKKNAPQENVDRVQAVTRKYMHMSQAPASLEDKIYVAVLDEIIQESLGNGLAVVL